MRSMPSHFAITCSGWRESLEMVSFETQWLFALTISFCDVLGVEGNGLSDSESIECCQSS